MPHPPLFRRAAGLAALLCTAAAPADPAADAPVPLAVRAGRCSFVLPAGRPGDKYLLVVGSLSRGLTPHRVTARAESTDEVVSLPLADDDPGPAWRRYTNEVADRLAQARKARTWATDYPPAPDPPRRRDFHLFAGGNNFADPSSFAPVRGELRGIGRHCLVYVDAAYPDPAGLQPTVDEVIRVFDGVVFPAARDEQGHCLDVDRDGRFAVLFSAGLSRLAAGQTAVSGFVRGTDFYRDAGPPYGNRCDMLYLSTDLRPGPFLRTLIAHEYTHAVVLSEHAFGDYLPGVRHEEESWLNEGLAHLAEARHGFGWGNLDYRVSRFLAAPRRYPLVVPDYYGAGLWRDPGCRGAAYLFLHACACEDAGLSAKLVRSNLAGVQNLEAATREPFAALFRRWTLALARGAIAGGHDLYGPLGGRLLCGVRRDEVPLSGGRWESDLAGTAAAYLLLHSPGERRSRVTVEGDAGADLQVTLVPLPADSPRLSLRAERVRPGAVRLTVAAHDAPVTLEEAAREKVVPAGKPGDTSYRPEAPPGASVRAWFGGPKLATGEQRTSGVIELPAGEGGAAWLFKVLGRDAAGRAVAAEVEAGPN
jgi:hypothetical protein